MKGSARILLGITLGVAAAWAFEARIVEASGPDQSELGQTVGTAMNTFFDPCPVADFPRLESIVTVPSIIDPFDQDTVPVFCEIQAMRGNKPVRNARGNFVAEIFTTHNGTGQATGFQVDSGKFKTDANGSATFDFDLPTELFADGFESGDLSAWSFTRADFSNRKKATSTSLECSSSKSSGSRDS